MEYLNRMKTIQNLILEFLDDDDDDISKFEELSTLLNYKKIQPDPQELKSILYLISKISKNHHRQNFFIDKIKRIIIYLKEEIKQTFSNIEIFNFFKKNKRILLLLLDENIITFDSNIFNKIGQYKDYFYTEINKLNQKDNQFEVPEDYEEKRRKGENDFYICEIIRNDDIEKFAFYYAKNEIKLSMPIKPSIYETNSFLIKNNPTVIEYSAFYGSIQILRFLFQNKNELTQSLWLYAIHGKNPEIIHFLEENQIYPNDESYQDCLKESIKCHHNDFALYFLDNLIVNNDHSNYLKNEISYGFHFYNFQFIPIEVNEPFCFFYAVEHDYYKLVEYYHNIEGLNINDMIIQNYNCKWYLQY